MSPIWASTSQFYSIEDIDHNATLNITQSTDSIESASTNKNLSKMRSYLKRCENAINSINLSGKRSTNSAPSSSSSSSAAATTTNADSRTKQSTSSWYIDEFGSEINESHNDFNDNVDSHSKVTQIMESTIYSIPDTQSSAVNDDNANDRHEPLEYHPMLLHVSKSSNHCYCYFIETLEKSKKTI